MRRLLTDPVTGEEVGYYTTWGGREGPVIWGKTEFVPGDSFKERCLAAISTREGPLRLGTSIMRPSTRPSLDCVQAYEFNNKHGRWMSAGLCHSISANGNLQRLLTEVRAADSSSFDAVAMAYGLDHTIGELLFATGEAVEDDAWAEPKVVCGVHKILGLPSAREPSVNHFASLITERDSILKDLGWYDAVYQSERLRLITASMAINMGTSWFKDTLKWAKEKTPEALTDARIKRYGGGARGFGATRSMWELTCDYAYDDATVEW